MNGNEIGHPCECNVRGIRFSSPNFRRFCQPSAGTRLEPSSANAAMVIAAEPAYLRGQPSHDLGHR